MAPDNSRPRRVVRHDSRNTNTTAGGYETGDILTDDTGRRWQVSESPAYDGTAASASQRTVRNGWIE